jgi:hypothetical protein
VDFPTEQRLENEDTDNSYFLRQNTEKVIESQVRKSYTLSLFPKSSPVSGSDSRWLRYLV